MSRARIAADVGGTFTDVVLLGEDGRIVAFKVPSTPQAFETGVLQGIAEALERSGTAPSSLHQVLHATTAGTNAVLERSGPAAALITTRGFRDVLEIGRLRTPTIYDLAWRKPVPLVPRRLRLEVTERIAADGTVVTPLEVAELSRTLDDVVAQGVVSVAVSLINAHVNPEHEQALAAFVADRHPHLFVTPATAVVREIGEYERTSTAVLNAYLRPVLSAYLDRLAEGLLDLGTKAPILVMQSSGGMMPVAAAADLPVHLCESGPAAGVLAAAHVARTADERLVISFDMGGTTAKASLIEDFTPLYASELSVGSELSASSQLLRGGGYTVRLPVVDLAEVGAGGGSIARVDASGSLVVGPASAGAAPGPACYAKGGTAGTVTDANLLLGYVSREHLVASGAGADLDLAAGAIGRDVAEPLGLTVTDAALAVHRIANQQMARVLRAVSTERGRTLSDYTLVAFGGGGGLHAASLAAAVGIRRVVVPPLAGVLSTVGLLWAPVELTVTETLALELTETAVPLVAEVVRSLAAEQRALLEATLRSGSASTADEVGSADVEVLVHADLRYVGEGAELTIPLDRADLDPAAARRLTEAFHDRHLAEYGHGGTGAVEVVRVRATARRPADLSGNTLAAVAAAPDDQGARTTQRTCRFDGGAHEVPVRTRAELVQPTAGPVLVDEADTTTVVPPGWHVHTDAAGNLVLEVDR